MDRLLIRGGTQEEPPYITTSGEANIWAAMSLFAYLTNSPPRKIFFLCNTCKGLRGSGWFWRSFSRLKSHIGGAAPFPSGKPYIPTLPKGAVTWFSKSTIRANPASVTQPVQNPLNRWTNSRFVLPLRFACGRRNQVSRESKCHARIKNKNHLVFF